MGGVGQRMLSGVAKRLATQFFTNIDKDLAAGSQTAAGGDEELAGGDATGDHGAGVQPAGQTGTPRAGAGAPRPSLPSPGGAIPSAPGQLLPMLTGAAVALVGVAVGARLRRR
ncbi:hypothetical protein [Ornithinimicrobium pratense]|uniref:hypothetical protein n=1 Tax=Ornithinimicrobium pratense TaxID=2593973 RepID=UPI001EE39354|nr:hypothetical protein [Ornithinimicrobium pratense]